MMTNSTTIELERLNYEEESTLYQDLFKKYDLNKNGMIELKELIETINGLEYAGDIPKHVVKMIFRKADKNKDDQLSYNEFVNMLESPENNVFFTGIKRGCFKYVDLVVYKPKPSMINRYGKEYSCCPPPMFMIIISLVEIGLFLLDSNYPNNDENKDTGPVVSALTFNPHKKKEFWRYFSYIFVHSGYSHLIVNVLFQLLLGIPLEMVHKGWRILLIYTFVGVISGSLGTNVIFPNDSLIGASGGVYSLITAHLSTIIMNWSEMSHPSFHLLIYLSLITCDVGNVIYNRYTHKLDRTFGYTSHFCGALTGFLIGFWVLRNFEVKKHEKIIQGIALVIFISLFGGAIFINVSPDNFPSLNV